MPWSMSNIIVSSIIWFIFIFNLIHFFYSFADEEGHHSPPESPIAHARKQQDYPPHCTALLVLGQSFVHVLIVRKQLITPFPLKQQSPLLPKMEYFPYSNSDYYKLVLMCIVFIIIGTHGSRNHLIVTTHIMRLHLGITPTGLPGLQTVASLSISRLFEWCLFTHCSWPLEKAGIKWLHLIPYTRRECQSKPSRWKKKLFLCQHTSDEFEQKVWNHLLATTATHCI